MDKQFRRFKEGLSEAELASMFEKAGIHHYLGSWSYDDIDYSHIVHSKPPFCLMINTSREEETKGEHWVAIWISESQCEFFDSFGLTPIVPGIMKLYDMIGCLPDLDFNEKQYQDFSTPVCGYHCFYYLAQKVRRPNKSMKALLKNIYTDHNDLNDVIVTMFGESYLNKE